MQRRSAMMATAVVLAWCCVAASCGGSDDAASPVTDATTGTGTSETPTTERAATTTPEPTDTVPETVPETAPPPTTEAPSTSAAPNVAESEMTVESDDGRATLTVRAGTELPDEPITLTADPSAEELAGGFSAAYVLEPSGTTFDVPATLVVTMDAPAAPAPDGADENVVMSWIALESDDGSTEVLPGDVVALDGAVTATVEIPHFSKLVIGGTTFASDTTCSTQTLGDLCALALTPPTGWNWLCCDAEFASVSPGFEIFDEPDPDALESMGASIVANYICLFPAEMQAAQRVALVPKFSSLEENADFEHAFLDVHSECTRPATPETETSDAEVDDIFSVSLVEVGAGKAAVTTPDAVVAGAPLLIKACVAPPTLEALSANGPPAWFFSVVAEGEAVAGPTASHTQTQLDENGCVVEALPLDSPALPPAPYSLEVWTADSFRSDLVTVIDIVVPS